jgi:predicted MFS family arabinose efflux permease
MAALYTLQQQRAIAVDPRQSNLRLALNNSAMYFGASIGSALGGIVILKVSLAILPTASAAIAATGFLLLILLRGDRSRYAPNVEAPPSNLSTESPEGEI